MTSKQTPVGYLCIEKHTADALPTVALLVEGATVPSTNLSNPTAAKIALVGIFSKLIDSLTITRSDIRAGRCPYLRVQDYHTTEIKDFIEQPRGYQFFFREELVSNPPQWSLPLDNEYTTQLEFKFEEKKNECRPNDR